MVISSPRSLLDHREDLFPTLSALRTSQIVFTTCGMVHQVFGDKFVDDAVITGQPPTKQLFDDILRFPAFHPLILSSETVECQFDGSTSLVVVGGVDTHLDVHVAAALDVNGAVLGVRSFATTPDGHHALSCWLGSFGPLERVGVEGTGTYGAGLARHLQRRVSR